LDATIKAFLADIGQLKRSSEAGERLQAWLLAPLDRRGKKLIVLPSGRLSRLPLEALLPPDSEVVYAFSSQLQRVSPSATRQVVGLGGLPELPATVAELNLLRERFPGAQVHTG